MLTAALLLIVAGLYWAPSHVATLLGWHEPAVDYVVGRLELAMLWLVACALLAWRRWSRSAAPLALWAAAEAGLGAAARLALPMCCPLTQDARPLAVQAWGPAGEWVSALLAAAAVWWVAFSIRSGKDAARHDHAAS